MIRYIFIALGLLCVGLGVLGIILPVLPTTPFLLLASWLFYRSSEKLRLWLLNHPRLGPYIRHYQIDKAIPLRGKIVSISLLWGTMLITMFCFISLWWVRLILAAIAVGVTIHILSFKTLKLEKNDDCSEELSKPDSES